MRGVTEVAVIPNAVHAELGLLLVIVLPEALAAAACGCWCNARTERERKPMRTPRRSPARGEPVLIFVIGSFRSCLRLNSTILNSFAICGFGRGAYGWRRL